MNFSEDHSITSETLEKYASEFSRLGSEYFFSRFTNVRPLAEMSLAPSRMPGVLIAVIVAGAATIEVNLATYRLEANSVAVMGPDCLIQVTDVDCANFDSYIFIASTDFLRDINLDVNMLSSTRFSTAPVAVQKLSEDETSLMLRYFDLIHSNTVHNSDEKCVRSISRCLVSASVYQLMQFALRNAAAVQVEEPRSRRYNYVKDFMAMVHRHHRTERSVSYYASRLYISPKYLSLIVKEATGRSAAQWIDEFVILEAKNLLRFSGKNVQQIAYELNFSNQSSFGKYFKHITGMSPTEYQKS